MLIGITAARKDVDRDGKITYFRDQCDPDDVQQVESDIHPSSHVTPHTHGGHIVFQF
jgi:hypothetical protein